MNIEDFKKHFYAGSEYVHLNNAGQALIPDVNRDCAQHWLDRFYTEGANCAAEAWNELEVVRQKLAHFAGADLEEVAFFQTTASALSQAAFSIPLQMGDEILTWDQEYPSNFYPWHLAAQRASAKLVQVESENWQTPVQKILDRVTARTRVIALSWVQYQTGAVTDLQRLSQELRDRKIWLVADVIQGLGVRPFDFHESGFDIVCGGSHKWLCSNYGAGFMLVKKEKLELLEPVEVGAMTYGDPDTPKSFTITAKKNASKFEPGSKALIEFLAMGATLDLLEKVGTEKIFSEACRLADRLRQGLRARGQEIYSPEGPFVNFAPKTKIELETICRDFESARVSFAKRGPGIRLSVHGFNRDSEIERVLALVASATPI